EKERLSIAIIERDFPCGAIAIDTLNELFVNINKLLEIEDQLVLPPIDLTIYENSKFVIDPTLHLNAETRDEVHFKLNDFDILIDHSILRRSNIYNEIEFRR